MTPLSTSSFQILVVATNGSASSYTFDDANGTEWADGNLGGGAPNCTAATYLIAPSVSNPSATIAAAGTDWSACCIEVAWGAFPDITLSGLIIE